jgi:sec-independent protein translocase protein TatA
MPFGIGPLELIIFLIILLVIFGPKRLPAAGRALGQGMREFKDSVTGKDKGDDHEEERSELSAAAPPPPPAPVRPAGTEDASRAHGRDD